MAIHYATAKDAVESIKSGNRVFVHGSAATPHHLLGALADRASALQDVEIVAISTLGKMGIADEKFGRSFYFNSLFVSDNIRGAINSDRGEYIPIFLSEISKLFEKNILALDVALGRR